MGRRYVYFFGNGRSEGRGDMRALLGGKGAGLMEMTRIGLPVPPGFVITTDACALYLSSGQSGLKPLRREIIHHLHRLEKISGLRFGDPKNPLLVSVRSGAARSMPGMMETILNLGLNDRSVVGLAERTGQERFAYDAYRRFLQMYSMVVFALPRGNVDALLADVKKRLGVEQDVDVPADALRGLCDRLKSHVRERTGHTFPQDPEEQLWGAIGAVFRSWSADKAVTYRRLEGITDLKGTAVNVVQMVFGNMGERSGTGVCFTRDPNTGEKLLYGDVLMNAQGEDVVAGIRTPMKLTELKKAMPSVYGRLERIRKVLERHYRDMQDLEFTIEEESLYMLQCRTGKRSPGAAFRIATDMVREGLISREEAVARIAPGDIERLMHPVLDPSVSRRELDARLLATGIDAVPGAAVGEVVFTARDAEARAQEGAHVVLVRQETSPEDVGGMHAAQAILTATGGKTSHAAVVARGWGKPCIVGCGSLSVDPDAQTMRVGERTLHRGEVITLDGSSGEIFLGDIPVVKPDLPDSYHRIMSWADSFRTLRVRANVDTPYDARKAVEMGAEGIGLCRTEHMFFDTEERRLAIQEMIVAGDRPAREKALHRLLPIQRRDFEGIFDAMEGRPVTIRLIDPPLHEFAPHGEEQQRQLATRLRIPLEVLTRRITRLNESNPMLGHRGCRISLTYPEILEMQVRAILQAAVAVRGRGGRVQPEIMHPLIMDPRELELVTRRTHEVADGVFEDAGVRIPYLVGTMIEVPRAALLAGRIALTADFFSFGTNDLTQMTMALSRDDSGRFLPEYQDERRLGIFRDDPFYTLDRDGVGLLIRWAVEAGRNARSDLKIGICGEHGGEARSVDFCHEVGMDYVSCSPFRIPIARLAAAQAALARGVRAPRRGGTKGARKSGRAGRRSGRGSRRADRNPVA
ncbi:MAG: pyruvate, phosphate dikinase [Acidobacteriota bacterium]